MIAAFYVASVVAANLFTTAFGPGASIVSALAMIGATMVLRDRLHDEWRHRHLAVKMGLVIALAGAISALLNRASIRIAAASCIAFVLSETVDAIVYHSLRRRPWYIRSNISNVPAALVDSIVFPTIAFGGFLPLITAGQFGAKVAGGAAWSVLLKRAAWYAALVLLLAPQPASAQIVSVNGAWIHNPYVSAAAGELFVASPPIVHLRPYAILSWNTDAGAEPTTLLRVGYTRPLGRWALGGGAGVIRLPADRFRPSLSVIGFGPGKWGLRPYALAAYEKTPEWTWTTFVGVNYTLWFRR